MHGTNPLKGWLRIKRQTTPALGKRELAVLEILWRNGEQDAQQVLIELPDAGIGLNTVQSTLERLYRKKLAQRRKAGRAYRYLACVSKAAMVGSLLRDIADEIARGDLAPMVSGFMAYLDSEGASLDEALERIKSEGSSDA